jgi:hypothetical protein
MASAFFCAFYDEKPLYPQLFEDFFTGIGFFCAPTQFSL